MNNVKPLSSVQKILYVISDIQKSLAFEWIAKFLDRKRFDLYFILLGKPNTELANELKKLNIDVIEFPLKNNFITFIYVFNSLRKIKPDVVHTHLFHANLIGLTASKMLNVRKRIFTRHHGMVHYHEYPKGLKWDKYINRMATHIVAISQNTRNILILLDKADEKKIRVIHHGFNLNYFESVNEINIEALNEKYRLHGRYPVVGVISRYLHWKGVHNVIASFKTLLNSFPNAQLMLSNASGNYKSEIQEALKSLPEGSFTEIEFENDLASLYRLFDVYVHVPIDSQSEAFGQTYVEALASGVPSVFTLSGVASEFIVDEKNALVVPFQDSSAIEKAVLRILGDTALRNKLIYNGKQSIASFSIDKMINLLSDLYDE